MVSCPWHLHIVQLLAPALKKRKESDREIDASLRAILAELGLVYPQLTTDLCRIILLDEVF
jgi:hypothetical protein